MNKAMFQQWTNKYKTSSKPWSGQIKNVTSRDPNKKLHYKAQNKSDAQVLSTVKGLVKLPVHYDV